MVRRRRIRERIRNIVLMVLAFLLLFGLVVLFLKLNTSKKAKKDPVIEKEDVKVPKIYGASVFMVGDALIHSNVYEDARGTDGSYDFKPMLEQIKPISIKYDLKYYNQETILGGAELGYSNYPRFNSPTEVGDAFLDAGFNLVSLATNHTMDKGEAGVINSVNYWKSKENVVYSGQWTSNEEREESHVYNINGISYAFFSYTTWTNGLETPAGKEYLNNVYSPEKAAADIAKVKDLADVIIVAMHWGTEYSLGVSSQQTEIANYLSSLGVNLIIGAHPHVVEPVEYINDGKTFVIYSLGNFISDQIGIERLTGLMMEVTIKKVVDVDDTVTISIDSPKAELIYTYSKYGSNFKVYPYYRLDNTLLPNYMSYYEYYKSIVSSRYPELVWGLTGA
ncbi:MAG: CapA family protein [Bacilli bacterium]